MRRGAGLAVLVLVMFAGLLGFDFSVNYLSSAVFGSAITGAAVSTDDSCIQFPEKCSSAAAQSGAEQAQPPAQQVRQEACSLDKAKGKIICMYSSKAYEEYRIGDCWLECLPGAAQQPVQAPGAGTVIPPAQVSPGISGPNLAIGSIAAVAQNGNVFAAEVKVINNGNREVYIGESLQDTQGGGRGIVSFVAVKAVVEQNSKVVCEGMHYIYDPLQPGDSASRTIPMQKGSGNCVLERGTYVLDVVVDFHNHIIEADETNDNRKRQQFSFGLGSAISCPGTVGKDIMVGYRTAGGYCDASGKVLIQKEQGIACQNSYECKSNLCLGSPGVCVAACRITSDGKEVAIPAGTLVGEYNYCGTDGQLKERRVAGSCDGSRPYECLSGICEQNACVSKTDLRRALCELRILLC